MKLDTHLQHALYADARSLPCSVSYERGALFSFVHTGKRRRSWLGIIAPIRDIFRKEAK